jgi:hypothetical protein
MLAATKRVGSLGAVALACASLGLPACDVQTFDEAAAGFRNGYTPPPPEPPDDGTGGGFAPVFSEIQANVLTPDCATSGCHSGTNPAAGLNLEAASSYTMLVGIASTQAPTLQRVEQGDPVNSYLMQKLGGAADTGDVMPPTGALPEGDIAVIRQWIADGALDDRAQAAAPIRVTSLSPAPNASLTEAPAQIVAGFDRNLDTSTVNAMTFTVRGSGGDASFADGNEVQVTATSISVPGANPASAVFDLAGATLADDTYRVSLAGAGASLILDTDANALDGEFSGTFPSGNGVAGGNFTVQFAVATPVQLGPTIDEIQSAVLTPVCSGCHSPAGAAAATGLFLRNADESHASLVSVPSVADPVILRVAPAAPDDSYLVHKLENTGNVGVMPPTGMLPQTTIDVIREWIADGALR